MIKRIWDRISDAIPTEQAAYQPGRGTTEHVFAVKMIAEKAITSNDYTAFLLLLDMSKAFDTVDRELLFNHLEKVLEPDELHIMSRLTNQERQTRQNSGGVGEVYISASIFKKVHFLPFLTKRLKKTYF